MRLKSINIFRDYSHNDDNSHRLDSNERSTESDIVLEYVKMCSHSPLAGFLVAKRLLLALLHTKRLFTTCSIHMKFRLSIDLAPILNSYFKVLKNMKEKRIVSMVVF